jgi:uncharacterized protein (TIGR02265 family)
MAELRAQGAMFEGLFLRVLQPDEAFRKELLAVGFDVTRMEPSYPLSVWEACLGLAVQREYPLLPLDDGARTLGRRFSEGFFETIIGRLAAVMLPLLSGRRYVERIPTFVRMGVPELAIAVEWLGVQEALVSMPQVSPIVFYATAGSVDVGARRCRLEATVTPRLVGRAGELHVKWS